MQQQVAGQLAASLFGWTDLTGSGLADDEAQMLDDADKDDVRQWEQEYVQQSSGGMSPLIVIVIWSHPHVKCLWAGIHDCVSWSNALSPAQHMLLPTHVGAPLTSMHGPGCSPVVQSAGLQRTRRHSTSNNVVLIVLLVVLSVLFGGAAVVMWQRYGSIMRRQVLRT